MPIVRLSGFLCGEVDVNRSLRAHLLYLLFEAGWTIYNTNGDQRITLGNVEEKIIESQAFVFTPGACLEDIFKAVSVFVGYQTMDEDLEGKPMVILNSDGSWTPFLNLLEGLRERGTIRQVISDYIQVVESAEEVHQCLQAEMKMPEPVHKELDIDLSEIEARDEPPPADQEFSVCVFCSASIEDEAFLKEGYHLGAQMAAEKIGCVSGAGSSGIMGAVVKGASENGGWSGGSNVPHIIKLEGLPEGLSSFWPRPDIYTRMEIMIERSDAFVAMPGGAGTVQEVLALLILQQQTNPIMVGKPVVLFNRQDGNGQGFWDPFIDLLEASGASEQFVAVKSLDEILPTIRGLLK